MGRAYGLSKTLSAVDRFGLWVIVAAFLVLSLAYNVITPIFEAPDELWHFLNVKYIQDNRALIVQSSNGLDNPARQEGGQPPLYYLLSAAVISWLPTGPSEGVAVLNYDGQPGKVDVPLNKNVVIHSADENFPYHGVSLAVHLLRVFSILLSTGTVITTYAIAKEIFPESTTIQLGSAAFNAFVPQFIFISASINNDNLVILLSSLILLCLIRLAKGYQGRALFLALGSLTGLISLTKISSLGLVLLSILVVAVVAARCRSISLAAKGMGAVAVGLVVIGGWWYARNLVLYGDPLGLKIFLETVDRGGLFNGINWLFADIGMLSASFLALFGWSNIVADAYVYWFLDGLLAIGVMGVIYAGAIRGKMLLSAKSLLLLIPLAWLVILVVELMVWAGTVGYDVGRLMFPAISGISLLTVLGISRLWRPRFSSIAIGGLMVAMFGIAGLMPMLYIRPVYKQGIQFVGNQVSFSHPLNATFEDKMKLLGYDLSTDVAVPGQTVRVTLYWEPLPGLDDDLYRVALHLTSEDRARSLVPINGLLSEANVAKHLKNTDLLLRQMYEIKIPVDAKQFSRLPVVVRVEHTTGRSLEAFDGLMRPIGGNVVLTELKANPESN